MRSCSCAGFRRRAPGGGAARAADEACRQQAPTNKQAMLISGESALAQQSLLMETGLLTVAIGRKEYAELLKKGLFNFAADEEDANFILQVWNYPPALLVHPESRYVDTLSLILSLADSNDERVLQELNQLQLPWK